MDCNKVERIFKEEEILEDINYGGEGDIQDNVKGEIDEESRNHDNGEIDNLYKQDISLDTLGKELTSDDNSEDCNDVGGSNISYVNNPKEEETIEKIGDQLYKKVFCFPFEYFIF